MTDPHDFAFTLERIPLLRCMRQGDDQAQFNPAQIAAWQTKRGWHALGAGPMVPARCRLRGASLKLGINSSRETSHAEDLSAAERRPERRCPFGCRCDSVRLGVDRPAQPDQRGAPQGQRPARHGNADPRRHGGDRGLQPPLPGGRRHLPDRPDPVEHGDGFARRRRGQLRADARQAGDHPLHRSAALQDLRRALRARQRKSRSAPRWC